MSRSSSTAWIIVLISLAFAVPSAKAEQSSDSISRGPINLILVVDTSKSMRGVGGTANIFSDVINCCQNFIVEALRDRDTVTLISFAEDATVYPTSMMLTPEDRQRICTQIQTLSAEGNWTFTSLALQMGYEEAQRLESAYDSTYRQVFVVLTDGINDPPPNSRNTGPFLQDVSTQFNNKPWFLYFVQLDANPSPIYQDFENAVVFADPEGRDLQRILDELRGIIDTSVIEPVELHDTLSVTLSFEPEAASMRLSYRDPCPSETLHVHPSLPIPDGILEVSVDGIPIGITIDAIIRYSASDGYILFLHSFAEPNLLDSTYSGEILLSQTAGFDSLDIDSTRLEYIIVVDRIPPPTPYWLFAIIAAALVTFVVLKVTKYKKATRLHGELVWSKIGSDDSCSGSIRDLSIFGRRVDIGATGIKLEGENRILASLTCRKIDAEYHVIVSVSGGLTVRREGEALNELALFDRDEFEIEDWFFSYRGEVPSRRFSSADSAY